MKNQYWFKANTSGYGWHAHTWQGWVAIAIYLGFLIHSFIQINAMTHSVSDFLIGFFPRFLLFTALLTILTYLKGESITWGAKGKDQHKIP